jgi:hypothetical protein
MSLPTHRQGYSFLEPLRGKSAVFLIGDRKDNLIVSRFLLGCLTVLKVNATLFDTSCFYGVNIREITQGLSKEFLQQSTLVQFSDTSDPEDSLSDIVTMDSSAILIDDLNAILHLLSSQSRRSGIHRLATFYRVLSHEAMMNKLFLLGSIYKSKPQTTASSRHKRSLADFADLQITVETEADELAFHCNKIVTWPTGGFRAPVYLEPST